MVRGRTAPLALLVALLLAATGLAAPAVGAGTDPVATATTLGGTPAHEGHPTSLTVRLTTADGTPLAGREVSLQRRRDGAWVDLDTVRTDADGRARATAPMSRAPADNTFRATYAGEAGPGPAYARSEASVSVPLRRRSSTLVLSGPRSVVDERALTLTLVRRTGEGGPVQGPVTVQRRAGTRWVAVATVGLDAEGRGTLVQRPRTDTTYRAVAPAQPWVAGATSDPHRVDNRPPGAPVVLPAGAPRPRLTLPPQPRATTAGPDPRISPIPAAVWSSMTGRSWHRGCPVGRAGLRLVRVNYWGFDGYRHRGEVVVAAWAAHRTARVLSAMHARRLPIRSMYRVDRFGWSRRLQGADDYRSMAADNTSGFNCRHVVGRRGVRSPHSYGGSVDVNPWENPYRSSAGWTPNRWWVGRSHPRVAWRSGGHQVVRLWRDHGFRWTYGVADAHHFDATRGSGRVIAARACTSTCH